MVQGTNFPPILQEKGAIKNMPFCNALNISKLYFDMDNSASSPCRDFFPVSFPDTFRPAI